MFRARLLLIIFASILAAALLRSPAVALGPTFQGFGTPNLDGVITPGEYDDCRTITLQFLGGDQPTSLQALLCIINDENNLSIAFQYSGDPTPGSQDDEIVVGFDRGDGVQRTGDDILVVQLNAQGDISNLFDGYVTAVSMNGIDSSDSDLNNGGLGHISAVVRIDGNTVTFEVDKSLCSGDPNDFCASPGDLLSFCFEYEDPISFATVYPAACALVSESGTAQNDALIRIAEPPDQVEDGGRPNVGGAIGAITRPRPTPTRVATAAGAAPALGAPRTGDGGLVTP